MSVNVANVAVVVNVKRNVKKKRKKNNILEKVIMVKYPFQFDILDN